MKSVGLMYRLMNCNNEPDGESIEVDINRDGIEAIFVDGEDMTDKSAKELMSALITMRSLARIIERSYEAEKQPDEIEEFKRTRAI